MAIEHNAVTDPNRHEPKGIIVASKDQVYKAAGGGIDGGSWGDSLPVGADTALLKQIFISDGAGGGTWNFGGSVHGEMVIVSNTVSVALTAAADSTLGTDTDYIRAGAGIGAWQSGALDNVGFSVDKLVISIPGDYQLTFWADLQISNTNTLVAVKFAINDLIPYSVRKISMQSNNANNVGNISGSAILPNMALNDTVSLYTAADAATNIIVKDAGMILTLLDAT